MPPRSASRRKCRRAAAALVLMAGCTAGPAPGPTPPPDRPAPSDTIRLAYPSVPPTLDPVAELSPAATDILRAVLPSFYVVTPDLAYRPYLLDGEPDVRNTGDRMSVRFRIRPNARWSDGTPITVADVAFTAEVMRRAPPMRRVEVAFVPDPTTAIQLLREGLVDVVAPMLGVSWGRRLGEVPGAQSGGTFGPPVVHLVVNAPRVPSVEDSRSVADAVDRGRFVDVVLRDEGASSESVVVPEVPGSVPVWARYGRGPPEPADIDGELSLVYVRGELLDLTARYLQAELRRAGIDLELVPLEADVFWGTFLPEGRFDLAILEVRGGPLADLDPWAAGWAGDDRTVRSLAGEAAEGDPTALAAAQRRLAALAVVLPLYQVRTAMGWREGVTGIQPNPSADGPLWNAWAWGRE